MIVRMEKKGRSITGLRVGTSNVRRYFRAGLESVDLELDHLRIRCDLQASFWRDRPEICDPRLCAWLQNKFFQREFAGAPISLERVGTGDSYRLTLPLQTKSETLQRSSRMDPMSASGKLKPVERESLQRSQKESARA